VTRLVCWTAGVSGALLSTTVNLLPVYAQEHIALPPVNLGGSSFMDGVGGPGLLVREALGVFSAPRFRLRTAKRTDIPCLAQKSGSPGWGLGSWRKSEPCCLWRTRTPNSPARTDRGGAVPTLSSWRSGEGPGA
jgi:hypothetical protein